MTRSLAKPLSMILAGNAAHCGSLFFACFASTFLALGHSHKVFSRLDIELLRSFVADHRRFFTALTAESARVAQVRASMTETPVREHPTRTATVRRSRGGLS